MFHACTWEVGRERRQVSPAKRLTFWKVKMLLAEAGDLCPRI